MRKLSKLKLKEFQEMSSSEMKNVMGGYTESSWCHEGEYLFHCVADFVGPVYGDPETTVDLGAVCARDRIDAGQKVSDTLSGQGIDNFGISCK